MRTKMVSFGVWFLAIRAVHIIIHAFLALVLTIYTTY
jgi:hypothetical protein